MTKGPPPGQQLILLCNCVYYDVIPKVARDQVFRALSRASVPVEVVPDLCGLTAHRDPRLQGWAESPSLTVIACFPRAVRWLFHAAGMPLSPERARFLNMRTQSPDEITRELMKDDGLLMIEKESANSALNHQSSIANHQSDWVPWFPVIDYDRCVGCKQCLNFCLFGVYALSDAGRVEVRKPSGCKTNCPACARMCPQQAIIFPKYPDPPINGDAAVGAGPRACPDGERPSGSDIYDRIRNRSGGGKRFSTGTGDPSLSRSCPTLDSLKRELNIPDDVLASLSPAEVQRIIGQSRSDVRPPVEKKDDEPHE